jgi:uncharacterized protein YecE (DUF72 family)
MTRKEAAAEAGEKAVGAVRIGVSGWTYAPWRSAFYPTGLPHRRELEYASRILNSIEINGTFYGMQRPESFSRWAAEVPDNFVFSVKAPRFITHIRRLREIETPVANFLASGVLALGAKLGPILWQFPPSFRYDPERTASFLALLPHDTEAAAELAKRHDARLKGRAWTQTDAARTLRHAMEIRHESFVVPDFIAMLRRHKVALVCADTVQWPFLMDVTADFAYCRLHGNKELYRSRYDDAEIDLWAARVDAWRHGREPPQPKLATEAETGPQGRARKLPHKRDVFVYFDNTDKLQAPQDAQRLAARLSAKR